MSYTVIVGASHQGRIILDILRDQKHIKIFGFIDDDVSKHGSNFLGLPILGGMEWVEQKSHKILNAIVAIGANDIRMKIANQLRQHRIELLNVIHPSATVMSDITIGNGNLICAGAIVVTGTYLENDIVVNTGSTIDHNCVLQTGAYISPGVKTAGCVTIGQNAFIGVGAILGPRVKIGDNSIIGAGSLVLSDIPANVVAFGSPAKPIRPITGSVDWHGILAGF